MNKILEYIKGDKVIWVAVIILSVLSILAVYSSTSTLAFRFKDGNTEYYMLKQLGLLLFGLFLMYLVHLVKFTYFSRISQLLLVVSVPLLIYTLLRGAEYNEASRWITIPGLNLTFQSSDLAKFALVIFLSRSIALKTGKLHDFNSIFYSLFLPVFLVVGLIFPANNSTAGIVLLISLLLLYFGGVPTKTLAKFTALTIIGLVVLLSFLMLVTPESTRVNTLFSRIDKFVNQDIEDGSQEEQALIAIASGRMFGKLPGKSTQKNILPNPYSDFIYAFIIEEYGLFGGIVVLLMYLIILYRGIRIAIRAPGTFSGLTALGITLLIVSQAMINMLVAVNLFPVTGQPLPLVSMGGTSILFTCLSLGILLSISREVYSNQEEQVHVQKAV